MSLLIDGYNLLHVTGIFGSARGPQGLERSRNALLNFLARVLSEDLRRQTTIVFDAKDAPPGLPRIAQHEEMTVHFASKHEEADDLIEELIRADGAPTQLTVVSSDRRIRRAARRRRASSVNSDRWYEETVREYDARRVPSEFAEAKPRAPLSETEVEAWLAEFGDVAELPDTTTSADEEGSSHQIEDELPTSEDKPVADLANPFPPGYAEDVVREFEEDAEQ